MRWRNDTAHPLAVGRRTIQPGETIDIDGHVTGLTPVPDPPAAKPRRDKATNDLPEVADATR